MKPILHDISVVIPTLGRDILEENLQSIAVGNAWPARLIVVDQGASPKVAGLLSVLQQSFGIQTQYIPSGQTGRSAALNLGLKHTTSRFVAVTDDDCTVDPDWLPNMLSHLMDAPGAIVTGRVLPAGEKVIVVVTSPAPAVYRRPQRKFSGISGGNMGTSMSVITRVGLFDEDQRLRTAEDKEWAYRALRAGVPIIYAPDIVVHHFGWRNEGERVAQYKDYARSHGGFYGKYLRRGDLYIALRALIHYLRALRRWMRGTATGDQELAQHGLAYLTGLLPGIIAGLREKEVS